ncbi:uncharacterized protein LOC133295622 [Gastrolobium bilobum]|uniref:uncharacterized protein LOC133295622 n=1 Tax=Gastrolobium bilobum TaxID=150636 RepID=UPI002AB1B0E5|nr:uncharacterized protein LOC133295622 [Gastrolobium bilobum]
MEITNQSIPGHKENPPDGSSEDHKDFLDGRVAMALDDITNAMGIRVGKREFPALIRDFKYRINIKVLALLETKIQGDRGDTIIKKLGFPKFFKQEAVGFSGGIWVLWDSRDVEVEIIQSHHQYVHTRTFYIEDRRWELVTFVYGSPRRIERISLWEDMELLAGAINSPWVILGDFNSVLGSSEKCGGKEICWRSVQEMHKCLEVCGMTDIGFKGPRFTWRRGSLQERIDRVVANEDWNLAWPNRVLGHLPYFNSDHKPILLSCYKDFHDNKSGKQFKFLAAWLTNSDFGNLVKKCWEKDVDWLDARDVFEEEATRWHHDVFREEMRQKHRIYVRIQGLDLQLEDRYDRELERLQRDLWKDLEKILLREELNWFQRSRVNWLKFGDKNSKFFHSSTVARRRFNKVVAIKNELGD